VENGKEMRAATVANDLGISIDADVEAKSPPLSAN